MLGTVRVAVGPMLCNGTLRTVSTKESKYQTHAITTTSSAGYNVDHFLTTGNHPQPK